MSEPPRPPGDGTPDDPTSPYHPPAGGGYPPPGGAYPPPGSPPPPYNPPPYNQPPYNPPPQTPYGGGYGSYPGNNAGGEDRTWLLVAHFGGAAGALIGGGTLGWIAPLVSMMSRGPQSPYVRAESVKALNFQLVMSIVAVVCWALGCLIITWVVAVAAMIMGIVFGVIAGAKAANGESYNYPLNISIVK
jgi:uncharacterized Tic20 family protein